MNGCNLGSLQQFSVEPLKHATGIYVQWW